MSSSDDKVRRYSIPLPSDIDDILKRLASENDASVASILKQLVAQGLQEVASSQNSVVGLFEFPEEIRVACEQYLLYFVEFLRDVGIDATAKLREDAGRVLFSVKPKNKDEPSTIF